MKRVIDAEVKISAKDFQLSDLFKDMAEIRIRDNVETSVGRQGHGLQRVLILALMQQLLLDSSSPIAKNHEEKNVPNRPVVIGVEEPELYMHPQMERKMRDTLRGLAKNDQFQLIVSTHSPVFLNLAESHREICRMEKNTDGETIMFQPKTDPFPGDAWAESKRFLRMV